MSEIVSIEDVKIQRLKNHSWVSRFLQNKKAVLGAVILLIFILAVLLVPVIRPIDPNRSIAAGNLPPSAQYPLGTMYLGQDGLAQLLWGGRISLSVGFATGFIATLLSVVIGMSAGYFRGWVNDIFSMLINVFLIIPGLPLAIILAAFLPPSKITLILVLSITGGYNAKVSVTSWKGYTRDRQAD